MSHIYNCRKINKKKEIIEFEKVFNGKLLEQENFLKGFRRNMETRENNIHEIDKNQSANFCTDFSNGNTYIDK